VSTRRPVDRHLLPPRSEQARVSGGVRSLYQTQVLELYDRAVVPVLVACPGLVDELLAVEL